MLDRVEGLAGTGVPDLTAGRESHLVQAQHPGVRRGLDAVAGLRLGEAPALCILARLLAGGLVAFGPAGTEELWVVAGGAGSRDDHEQQHR